MADQSNQRPTITGAILSFNPKIVLAFFLVVIATGLTVWMGNTLVQGKADAGTAAVISGIVMIFVKMAADACGYQTQSSAGSDKKDDAQTAVSKALAEKVPAAVAPPTPPPAPIPPTVVVAWWSALTPDEQAALELAGQTDQKVKAFVDASKIGKATPDDLAYLVSKIPPLLTQEKATALAAL